MKTLDILDIEMVNKQLIERAANFYYTSHFTDRIRLDGDAVR